MVDFLASGVWPQSTGGEADEFRAVKARIKDLFCRHLLGVRASPFAAFETVVLPWEGDGTVNVKDENVLFLGGPGQWSWERSNWVFEFAQRHGFTRPATPEILQERGLRAVPVSFVGILSRSDSWFRDMELIKQMQREYPRTVITFFLCSHDFDRATDFRYGRIRWDHSSRGEERLAAVLRSHVNAGVIGDLYKLLRVEDGRRRLERVLKMAARDIERPGLVLPPGTAGGLAANHSTDLDTIYMITDHPSRDANFLQPYGAQEGFRNPQWKFFCVQPPMSADSEVARESERTGTSGQQTQPPNADGTFPDATSAVDHLLQVNQYRLHQNPGSVSALGH